MITCGNCTDVSWDIYILRETEEGFLCMSPVGETMFLDREEYYQMVQNKKSHVGRNIYTYTEGQD
jgi:hypothetical protein